MVCEVPTISAPSVTSKNCYDGTVTSHTHWYFKRSVGSTAGHTGKTTKSTTAPHLAITLNKPETSSSYQAILISSVGGSVFVFVLIGSIILTICYKRRNSQPPSGPNPNVIGSSTNTAVSVLTSDRSNQCEDIDNYHNQTEQGQSGASTQSLKLGSLSHNKVLAALKPNPMYGDAGITRKDPASTNNHDKTGQVQSQANAQSLIVGNLSHDEVLAALKPNVMYAGVETPKSPSDHNQYEDIDSHHDQTGQGKSQAITEYNVNTTAAVTVSGRSQTEDQLITEALGTKRPQCSTLTDVPNSKLNTLYKDVGQYQAIAKSNTNTTAAVVTSGLDHQYENINKHDQTGPGQSHAITEPVDDRNLSYGTGKTASQLNSLYAN
uniref:Uncharacterized protein n=1 Tax=Branchiostoma floridae TaxID=7739 RepID=C3YQF8_BRAFL|eukprot:XP_002601476.1 hypothetical protein BRAFLDRAFT_102159 [Branchiostoma floridae]